MSGVEPGIAGAAGAGCLCAAGLRGAALLARLALPPDFFAGRALRRAAFFEDFAREAPRATFLRRGALRFAFFFATVSPPLQ